MPKDPYNNLLFDHLDGSDFSYFFGFHFSVIFPTSRGENCRVPYSAVVIIAPALTSNDDSVFFYTIHMLKGA